MFLHTFILTSSLIHLAASTEGCSSHVTVTCQSCALNSQQSEFQGALGSSLTVMFEINNQEFQVLTVMFDGEKNKILVAPTNTFRDDGLTDSRLTGKFHNLKNSIQVIFTLNSLLLSDDGKILEYVYRPKNLDEYVCKRIVKVVVPSTAAPTTIAKIIAKKATTRDVPEMTKIPSTAKRTDESSTPTPEKRQTTKEKKSTEMRKPPTTEMKKTTEKPTLSTLDTRQTTAETEQTTTETKKLTTDSETTVPKTKTTTTEKRTTIADVKPTTREERQSEAKERPSTTTNLQPRPLKLQTTKNPAAKTAEQSPTTTKTEPKNEKPKPIIANPKPTTSGKTLTVSQNSVRATSSSVTSEDKISSKNDEMKKSSTEDIKTTLIPQPAGGESTDSGQTENNSKSKSAPTRKMKVTVEDVSTTGSVAPKVIADKQQKENSAALGYSAYKLFVIISTTMTVILLL